MQFLKRLFRRAAPPVLHPSAAAALDPTFVPTPKAKVPGAAHPLVLAKANKPKGRAIGVGVVYDAAGKPKITADWLLHLSPQERAAVDADLFMHGWKVSPDGSAVTKIKR